jgi:uncharacterized protein with PIN domain
MKASEVREPRFLADAMLERLARWLRVLGFDTQSGSAATDGELVRRAEHEGRALLTRDRRLAHQRPERHSLLIRSDAPLDQLREVMTHFQLQAPRELFTRCLICNAALRSAAADEIGSPVPPSARERPESLRRCPSCGRIYWEGAHTRRMRAALERALRPPETRRPPAE